MCPLADLIIKMMCQVPALKSSTFSVRPKVPEQQPPSQDISAVLAKLSSMEKQNKYLSLENKISLLEKKVDASERRAVATAKAIRRYWYYCREPHC